MAYLVNESEVIAVDGKQFEILEEIPAGAYKVSFSKMHGTYLTKTEIKLSHGKIYSKSQSIADHIVESYKKNDPAKNMGVLLSGERGLGKTLTSRLVIEQLIKDHPIIMCSMYTPDLADFLSRIKNAVILMDEFEKFMGGNIQGNDAEDEQTKQETILSVLDGNTGSLGNLYLLTVNNVYKLDDNLKSRPGRIRYHYKYTSEAADVVRNYCLDNLNNKDLTEEVVKTLGMAKYVSMDIISSFVKELNDFPNTTPSEVLQYLNIEQDSEGDYTLTVKISCDGQLYTYSTKNSLAGIIDGLWYKRKVSNEEKKAAEENDEIIHPPRCIYLSLNEDDVPSFIYNTEELSPEAVEIVSIDGIGSEETPGWLDKHDFKLLKATIKDDDFQKFLRKYDKKTV